MDDSATAVIVFNPSDRNDKEHSRNDHKDEQR